MVWSCLPFIRSGQNHLARHSEREKKTRRTKEGVGRQHQGMDRPGVRQVQEGSGEQGKMVKTGCKIICGAPTTLAVKGLMMMNRHVSSTGCSQSANPPDLHAPVSTPSPPPLLLISMTSYSCTRLLDHFSPVPTPASHSVDAR